MVVWFNCTGVGPLNELVVDVDPQGSHVVPRALVLAGQSLGQVLK